MSLNKFKKLKLKVDNKEIFYLQSGQGPSILFLHGLGIGTNIWKNVCKNLKGHFTFILLDLPGYGLNKNLVISPKFEVITQFINNFIKKKGAINYLVGYSISGVYTYPIAQNPPSSLKKIIYVSTPFFYHKNIKLLNLIFKIIGINSGFTKVAMFFITRFPVKHLIFSMGGLASIINPKDMNICMKKFGKNTKTPYIFQSASTIFTPTAFAPTSIPINFIYGERDGFAKPKKNPALIIKDAYHLLPIEKPQELALLIEKSCFF